MMRMPPLPKVIRRQVDIVPATQSGFSRITRIVDDDHHVIDLAREPIVAWCVETKTFDYSGEQQVESDTTPITLGRSYATGYGPEYAVEYPDGRCEEVNVQMFPSAAVLLEYWQRFYQKHDPRQLSLSFMGDGEPKDERS